jgi:hypothetical protein
MIRLRSSLLPLPDPPSLAIRDPVPLHALRSPSRPRTTCLGAHRSARLVAVYWLLRMITWPLWSPCAIFAILGSSRDLGRSPCAVITSLISPLLSPRRTSAHLRSPCRSSAHLGTAPQEITAPTIPHRTTPQETPHSTARPRAHTASPNPPARHLDPRIRSTSIPHLTHLHRPTSHIWPVVVLPEPLLGPASQRFAPRRASHRTSPLSNPCRTPLVGPCWPSRQGQRLLPMVPSDGMLQRFF